MTVLSDELTNDPTGKGYASFLPCCPGKVVDLLNAYTETKVKPRMISVLGILADYPGGPQAAGALLDKLDAAAPSISALKWAWKDITGVGLDIGHKATQEMLDILAQLGTISSDEATNLKNLAIQPASRMEVLELPVATEEMVRSV